MALTLASASTSSSSSPSPRINHSYQVFLNHRGTDVKKTFASHLYRRLLDRGLQVFLDQSELERGEDAETQIEQAISSASVHVAILSPRYAESRWLLVMMLKSMESGSATTIPVFYNVKPSDLRWTNVGNDNNGGHEKKGTDRVYAQALLNHEKKGRYDEERLAAWRKALSDASYISGFELEACNCDEGELVDQVARQVQKKVRKALLLVAEHPTGLDEKLQDFERTVFLEEQNRGECNVVGIAGLGGVGKSTLAKFFFNRKTSDYQKSCYLADVRDAAARGNLPSRQSELYECLTGSDASIHSIDAGIRMFRCLSGCQALIILDDVDDVEQLRALFLPVKDVLSSGSLILLTSRNKGLLRKSAEIEESSIYEMKGLELEHSQELLCSHAFHQPYPAAGYDNLVIKFLEVCQGLPLSLKVIGALLWSEDTQYWEDQLDKLCQVFPTEIQMSLKISYDSLDKQEQDIFLDIACFFIGVSRDTAIRVWDGSGWKGSLGLRTLQSKCLVTLDEENCLRMHDHLRDLGRDLAELAGYPRRLWRELFRNVPAQSTVRGISMAQRRSGESFEILAEFSNRIGDMSRLQIVRAPCDCLGTLFNVMRETQLLWLRCEISSNFRRWRSTIPGSNNPDSGWFTIRDLPSWIPIKDLRVLELECRDPIYEGGSHGAAHVVDYDYDPFDRYGTSRRINLGTLWKSESEAPLRLRELNIDVQLLQLPKSIGQLKFLEKIELHNFKGILPEEFFHLSSLKHLLLRAGMTSLPDSLGNLTNVQHIDLCFCSNLQTLPPSFGKLINLQNVKLWGCSSLTILPVSFGKLMRLKHLDLSYCRNLTPETLGNITHLQSLEELILDETELKELPSGIGDLRNLEILSLRHARLETLPHSIGKLKNLKQLTLSSENLEYFPDSVGELKQLTGLSITGSPIRKVSFVRVDSCLDSSMPRLKFLNLSHTRISEVSFGEDVCPVLQSLRLRHCEDLVEVGALPTTLTSLDVSCCLKLKKITGLRGLAKLQSLKMWRCHAVEELPGLETLISLRTFQISKCENMKKIVVLAEAANPDSDVLRNIIIKRTERWRI